MKKSLRWGFTLLGLTVLGLIPDQAMAANFTFTKIADTADGFSSFLQAPALNNAGTVAFSAMLSNGSTGVFIGNGGAITPFALSRNGNGTSPSFSSVLTSPSINNTGSVAFAASTNSPNNVRIFTSSGGELTPIATLNKSTVTTAIGYTITPAINDAGAVAFGAYTIPDPAPDQSYVPRNAIVAISQTGQLTTLSNVDNTNSSSTTAPAAPTSVALDKFNNVFVSSGAPGPMGGGAIFALSTDQPLRVIKTGGFYPVSINQDGTMYTAGSQGVAGGSTITIGNVNDPSQNRFISGRPVYLPNSTLVFQPSINDQNRVVFRANSTTEDGGSLFFDDYTNPANKIISVGDSLFGSTVSGIGQFSARGLNNADQVVFYARLADGRVGIFRAEPIPEPHTVIPSVALLVGFGMRTLRKRRKRLAQRVTEKL